MEEDNHALQPCELCGEETDDPVICEDCNLLLCPACHLAHDCDVDD